MKNNAIMAYCCANPDAEIQDVFKYIYQSAFGCEHLISNVSDACARIVSELENAEADDLPEVEHLEGAYCRVHLKMLRDGMDPATLCRLFELSARVRGNGRARLEAYLTDMLQCAREGRIPYDAAAVETAITQWKMNGYGAVHHSDSFRERHHPAYRVIGKSFLPFLPLFSKIDQLLRQSEKTPILVAIDGKCASGKTTLAGMLESIYDCNVFHMDDYFLRPEQRSAERLSIPGENVDHERFDVEILRPLMTNKPVSFRRFDCHKGKLEEPKTVEQKRLNIVEGVYCLHPGLTDAYDLTIFLDIPSQLQTQRIRVRNTPEMAERFMSTWIPLEEKYFRALTPWKRVDLTIAISADCPR